MSVFAELGLSEDADEGDVKRAYARRLRAVRPDEDAEGFQALNTAYKAALAAARWRAQAAADAAAAPETATPSFEALHIEPVEKTVAPEPVVADAHVVQDAHVVDEPVAAEPAPIDVPDTLFEYASTTDTGAIAFDFDAFSRDLFAVTADPDANLRAWLDARMTAWPIKMKPILAPHLLAALDDENIAISPRHFECLIEAFGLDDVLSGIDAVAIAQLRAANQVRFTKAEAVLRVRRLLAPTNRKELQKAWRVGRYPPFVAPMLIRLVTGRGAMFRTRLRWVPFLARCVMNLLRYASANAVDALSPPIEPRVIAKWQHADRKIGPRLAYLTTVLVVVMTYQVIKYDAKRDDFAAAFQEQRTDPEQAVRDYTAFINEARQPWTDDIALNVAIAHFNRGIILSHLDRVDEAMRSYRDLDGVFENYTSPIVRLQVAKGLLNLSFLSVQKGDFTAAIDYARTVVARYSGANDEQKGEDSFDLLVVKALNNQAEASYHLGGKAAALIICRGVLDRFEDATSDTMKEALDYTRSVAQEVEKSANSPPSSPQAVPKTETSGGPPQSLR